MNKYSKYLAPALALSMFAAVVLMASGQFDGSEQIAATSGSVESASSVGVDDYPVKGTWGVVPVSSDVTCPSGLLPKGVSGDYVRCSKESNAWIAVRNLVGVSVRDDLVAGVIGNGPVGVHGTGVDKGDALSVGVKGETVSLNSIGVLGLVNGPDFNSDTSIAVKAVVDRPSGGFGFFQKGSQAKNNFEGTLNVAGGLTVGYTTAPSVHNAVAVQVEGGLRVYPSKDRPTCAVGLNGLYWFNEGSVGVADSAQVCAKNANGTYSWKNLF